MSVTGAQRLVVVPVAVPAIPMIIVVAILAIMVVVAVVSIRIGAPVIIIDVLDSAKACDGSWR